MVLGSFFNQPLAIAFVIWHIVFMEKEPFASSPAKTVAVASVFYVGVLGAVYTVYRFAPEVEWLKGWGATLISMVFITAAFGGFFASGKKPAEFGLTLRGAGRGLIEFLVAGSAVTVAYIVSAWAAYRLDIFIPETPDPVLDVGVAAKVLLIQLLYAALPEELFFRGYLQTTLHGAFGGRMILRRVGLSWACVAAAVLFAAGHFAVRPNAYSLLTFFPGLLYGVLRRRTENLLAPVLLHALCNMLAWAVVSGAVF